MAFYKWLHAQGISVESTMEKALVVAISPSSMLLSVQVTCAFALAAAMDWRYML
jgi:hypothetical protein